MIDLRPRLGFANLRGDLYGGVTAAVVVLPLALAFGVASGAGPVAGVYGAICVGLFAALFGGTPAQVSGPTGPMTVVMAAVYTQYAQDPAIAFTVVFLAGLIQIGLGVLRLGRFINLMPYPVISGFMSGIGCIIIVIQLGPLLGATDSPGQPLAALAMLPHEIASANAHAIVAGAVALGVALFLPPRISRWFPSSLAALFVGTFLVLTVLNRAPVLGEIPSGFPSPRMPTLDLAGLPYLIQSAIVLAVLGAIDSLLTSLVADNITRTRHDSDRELVGQGIGNAVAGLLGAIPGAGATMRTVVNVRAGGRTSLSGVVHALILLAIMLGLGPLAAAIPHAVLAGILIKTGVGIIDWSYLRRVRHAPWAGVLMMFTVLGLTVFTDLITAVLVGVVMASLLFVKRMADLQLGGVRAILEDTEAHPLSTAENLKLKECDGRVAFVQLSGPMSFGAANELGRRALVAGDYRALILDLSEVPFIDSSASLAVEGIVDNARTDAKEVFIVGLQPSVAHTLNRMGVLKRLGPGRRFRTRLSALARAAEFTAPAPKVAPAEAEPRHG